ncbi:hypothetical protein [Glaciihabitans sp. UYNi722]|uniref:hypothetical protein n=1 Tax=Glaciihabitans sp. UYNi722 TaxID=3156344 RepID=UPI00339465B6
MIPRVDIEIESDIPAGATFWTPVPDDIGDEGFGFFQDVWPILDVSENEASEVIDAERVAVAFADSGSTDEREFEDLAKAIEDEYPDSLGDDAQAFMADSGWGGLESLELGVAGLVYALAACGFFPAASCRSHYDGMSSWSEYPVVMFAADEMHTQKLQPFIEASGCGLEGDSARSDLLCIYAPSIVEMMLLASALIAAKATFD